MTAELIAVRHGQSVANAAFAAADAAGLEHADVDGSDAGVRLTALGREQATDVGRWLASRGTPPEVVLTSPYLRTRETTDLALNELRRLTARRPAVLIDERLRDRDNGVLELLTAAAIRRLWPQEAARLSRVGEFFYRPTAGESMADVALRVRSVLRDVVETHAGRRVLLIGHDAIVLMLRYIIEAIPAEEVLGLGPVLNGSVTRWTPGPEGLRIAEFNAVDHLRPT